MLVCTEFHCTLYANLHMMTTRSFHSFPVAILCFCIDCCFCCHMLFCKLLRK